MEWIDSFDELEVRAAKLVACAVLLLVVGLIVADVIVTALHQSDVPVGEPVTCVRLPNGEVVCDVTPPNPSKPTPEGRTV